MFGLFMSRSNDQPATTQIKTVVVREPAPVEEETQEEAAYTADIVERLMGTKPEYRFQFIQEHAKFVENLDI